MKKLLAVLILIPLLLVGCSGEKTIKKNETLLKYYETSEEYFDYKMQQEVRNLEKDSDNSTFQYSAKPKMKQEYRIVDGSKVVSGKLYSIEIGN